MNNKIRIVDIHVDLIGSVNMSAQAGGIRGEFWEGLEKATGREGIEKEFSEGLDELFDRYRVKEFLDEAADLCAKCMYGKHLKGTTTVDLSQIVRIAKQHE